MRSTPTHWRIGTTGGAAGSSPRTGRLTRMARDPYLAERSERLRSFSRGVRSSEYHLTNACNIRCEGCWFFEYDFDRHVSDRGTSADWRSFARSQAEAGITAALLIGGEPTLYPDRIAAFAEAMPYVTISTNGLRELPRRGFERVAIALTLFGGGAKDDELRAIRPNGTRFSGLFEAALRHYKDDSRATFVYALDPDSIELIDGTVRRIRDNGNQVTFNYYSRYGQEDPLRHSEEERLLDEALRVHAAYPETVICHPYFIRALITGTTEWGRFEYETCPSISVDHPAHKDRLKNGNPVLPGFNAFAADMKTVKFCCTSGHCDGCRDSQAVYSWLITNVRRFLRSKSGIQTWIELAESYWRQFVWSEYHRSAASRKQ